MIIISLLFFMLVAAPAWLMWVTVQSMLPKNYSVYPHIMACCCLVFAFVTGAVTNNISVTDSSSGLMYLLIASLLWSAVLLPVFIICQFFIKGKSSHN